jgi:hypothetical protein
LRQQLVAEDYSSHNKNFLFHFSENVFCNCFRGNSGWKIPTTAESWRAHQQVKYKCLSALTLHAFHPKAVND